jgi:hypothetical protein
MSWFSENAVRNTALLFALALPAAAGAQDTGQGFLFGTPAGSFTLRGGWSGASARSDLFAFTTSNLTLRRGDFSSPELGADLAFRAADRTQIVLSADLSGVNRASEFRNYIDDKNQPIEQRTTFRRVPVTLSAKQYLTAPGRAIGRFSWIPSRAAAYVGLGGGIQYYQFEQDGDFIDFDTYDVFHDHYKSEGWAPIGHVLAGFDYTLSPRFALTTEGRYARSSARLSRDFSGFERLDLSGYSTTVGLTVRF